MANHFSILVKVPTIPKEEAEEPGKLLNNNNKLFLTEG